MDLVILKYIHCYEYFSTVFTESVTFTLKWLFSIFKVDFAAFKKDFTFVVENNCISF